MNKAFLAALLLGLCLSLPAGAEESKPAAKDPCKTYKSEIASAMQGGAYTASQAAVAEFDKVLPVNLKNDCGYSDLKQYLDDLGSIFKPGGLSISALFDKAYQDISSRFQTAACNSQASYARCLPYPNMGLALNPNVTALTCNFPVDGLTASASQSMPTDAGTQSFFANIGASHR